MMPQRIGDRGPSRGFFSGLDNRFGRRNGFRQRLFHQHRNARIQAFDRRRGVQTGRVANNCQIKIVARQIRHAVAYLNIRRWFKGGIRATFSAQHHSPAHAQRR
jgi:hypothetical protein